MKEVFDYFFSDVPPTPAASAQWVEESVFFEKKTTKQTTIPESGHFIGSGFSYKKSNILFISFVVFLSALFARLVYLQIMNGDSYLNIAKGNRERLIRIPAERGLFYDRNHVQLTTNIPSFSLAIVPQDLPREQKKRQTLIKQLSEITHKTPEEIDSILDEYGSYSYESIIIQENLDYETALRVQIESTHLPGIHIYIGSKRLYLRPEEVASPTTTLVVGTPSSLSHILGYLGKLNKEELDTLYSNGYVPSDSIGKTGVEKNYEDALRGRYGKRIAEVDALGREQTTLSEEPPIPGQHLVLSIDAKLQSKLEEIMRHNMSLLQKKRAAAVVMDPNNGEILALVSLPTFDNNDFSGGISQEVYSQYVTDPDKPLFNRVIGGTYPSGSTIKPAMASAALEEKIITPKTTVLSTGGVQIGQWFFPDWQAGGHGVTDVRKSLALSVNTFYYYIGGGVGSFSGLGVDLITHYLRQFGFSEALGIDIPGEADGFLPSKEWKEREKGERWYVGDTYNLSIGQGDLLVTPLQIASLTATIANKGTVYQPHAGHALIDPLTKKQTEIPAKILRNPFISPENIQTVRLGMRDCAISGSCRRLALLPFEAAGKTGTAQWSSTQATHAWFTSFAPFENPEIVVTILVEEGGEGSSAAVPIAYQFYSWWWQYQHGT